MRPRKLSFDNFQAWVKGKADIAILNVMPREYYEEAHIEGSLNACIYEIDFPNQIKSVLPDLKKIIVVHDLGAGSQAAAVAATRLQKLGYQKIYQLEVGTTELRNKNFPLIKGKPVLVLQKTNDGIYVLDTAKSTCHWRGRNITTTHMGTVNFSDGRIVIKDGLIEDGQFTIDMNTINDLDLIDPTYKNMLENHLKSEDFFSVSEYPKATFLLTKAIPVKAKPGLNNYKLTGDFTLKNKTHRISIPAIISIVGHNELSGQAHLNLDRTKWGVTYGSGKLFTGLLHHLVHDLIDIELRLYAKLK